METVRAMETIKRLEVGLDSGLLYFHTEQKGYGRQGLYVGGHYLMDVFPNVEEHFGLWHIDDAFWDEKDEVYRDCNGNVLDEECEYEDLDEWLTKHLRDEIQELIYELLEEINIRNTSKDDFIERYKEAKVGDYVTEGLQRGFDRSTGRNCLIISKYFDHNDKESFKDWFGEEMDENGYVESLDAYFFL